MTVSDASGGGSALPPRSKISSLGTAVDTNRWLVGSANPMLTVSGGVCLSGRYVPAFANPTSPQHSRPFSGRALCRVSAASPPGRRTSASIVHCRHSIRMRRPALQLSACLSAPRQHDLCCRDGIITQHRSETASISPSTTSIVSNGTEPRHATSSTVSSRRRTPARQRWTPMPSCIARRRSARGANPLNVGWVRFGPVCRQRQFRFMCTDAGQPVDWLSLTLDSATPTGTAVSAWALSSTDGVTWSGWAATNGHRSPARPGSSCSTGST